MIQQMMGELQCEPEHFTGRTIFMSMFDDIVWDARGHDELCVINSKTNKECAEGFPHGHWSFLGPGSEKKRYETYHCEPDGTWNRTAQKMLQNFKDSSHPTFRCTSALERGQLKSKGGGRTSIHFSGSTQKTLSCFSRVVTSVNQLSLYGAVADTIEELPVGRRAPGKLAASGQLEQEMLTQPPLAEVQASEERQGNPLQDFEERFERLPADQKLSRLCSEAGLRLVEVGQFFYVSSVTNLHAVNIRCLEMARGLGLGLGSLKHAVNRRRRTREGPEPGVQTPFSSRGGTRRGEKGELTSCRDTVQSAWQYLQ